MSAFADQTTKDWPLQLKINAEAIELAPLIYYRVCRVYGGGALWHALPREQQNDYIRHASDVLRKAHAAPSLRLVIK